jgi:hypothetical protein
LAAETLNCALWSPCGKSGAGHHTPKWTPGSELCYFADTRRFPSLQSMEAKHFPLFLTAKEPSLPCQGARMPDSPMREGKP